MLCSDEGVGTILVSMFIGIMNYMSLWEGIERRSVCGLFHKTVAKSDRWLLCLAVRLGRHLLPMVGFASKWSLGWCTEVYHHIWLKPDKNNNSNGDVYVFVTTVVTKVTFINFMVTPCINNIQHFNFQLTHATLKK